MHSICTIRYVYRGYQIGILAHWFVHYLVVLSPKLPPGPTRFHQFPDVLQPARPRRVRRPLTCGAGAEDYAATSAC